MARLSRRDVEPHAGPTSAKAAWRRPAKCWSNPAASPVPPARSHTGPRAASEAPRPREASEW